MFFYQALEIPVLVQHLQCGPRHALFDIARGPARARRPAPHALHFSGLSFRTGLAAVQVEEPLSGAPGPEAPFDRFGDVARAARVLLPA